MFKLKEVEGKFCVTPKTIIIEIFNIEKQQVILNSQNFPYRFDNKIFLMVLGVARNWPSKMSAST